MQPSVTLTSILSRQGLVVTHIYPCWRLGGVREFPPLTKGGQGGFCKHAQVQPAPEAAGPPLTRGNDRRGERLWWRVRGKQLLGVQFYRQKPIGNYIVDFHAPAVALVVEVDGAHHFEASQAGEDEMRTAYLEKQGLRVLRFTDLEVLQQLDVVVEAIFRAVAVRKSP